MSKLLTVFGATGNQGSSVIKAVLGNPQLSKTYRIRAITRNASKPAAVALKQQGLEVVTADLNDEKSVAKAIEGSNVVFGLTNFWEKVSKPLEVQQGKTIVNASIAAKVDLLIWSSLINVTKVTGGRINTAYHFDGKAEVEEYAKSTGIPASYILPAVFMPEILDNSFKKGENGEYLLNLPFDSKVRIPLIDPTHDPGLFVAAILLNPQETLNKHVVSSSGYLATSQIVEDFQTVTGRKAKLNTLPIDEWAALLPEGVRTELKGTFELIADPGYFAGEPADAVDKSLELLARSGLPKPTSWKEYVAKHFKASKLS
ncbi:hypothetical protein DV735_g1141, partial [Chaetothyriales sp. CBS 134920]